MSAKQALTHFVYQTEPTAGFDAVTSADTMRSVQIEASAHHSSRRSSPVASPPCLAISALAGIVLLLTKPLTSSFLPPFPRDGFATRPFHRSPGIEYYEGSELLAASPEPPGLSAFLALPSQHSVPNHVIRPPVALSVASAPSVVPGFATHEQARHEIPPKQVRHPTDCRFTSGCSPPHLAVTQLRSVSGLRPTQARTSTVLTTRPHGRTHGRPCAGQLCHTGGGTDGRDKPGHDHAASA